MQAEFFLKGIVIGLFFGMPIGAVGAMTVQRTLNGGIKAGLLTGLGSSVADCFYACTGVFGLSLISDFLISHQRIINLIGGSMLFIMGFRFLYRKEGKVFSESEVGSGISAFLSSFAVGITNPAAILTFLFAFSYFGVPAGAGLLPGVLLVCGVFMGTYFWWGLLSLGTDILRKNTQRICYSGTNQIFGIILALFGALVFIKNIL